MGELADVNRGKRRMLNTWSADGTEQLRHRNAGCSYNQKCEGNQFTALECCKLAADFKIASISAEMRDIRFIYGTKFCWSGQVSYPFSPVMRSRFGSVTSSRFKRRLPAGRHDLAFKTAFGTYAAAARFFHVSKMTIWRWRHDPGPLPEFVVRALPNLLQGKVAEAHQAQQDFRYFLAELPSGPSISRMHPVQLDDGRIVFVQRRRANSRR